MSFPVDPGPASCLASRTGIRLAYSADLPALQALAEDSANAGHWSRDCWERMFSSDAPPRLVLIAQPCGCQSVAGFIVTICSGPDWEIENVVVANSARRHGIATRLVAEVLDRARAAGAERIFLEVRESNCAARELYEKLGFVAAGRRPAYYSEPVEDAVVYRFGLSAAQVC